MKASWCRYTLRFSFTAVTSRASMREKDTWFLRVEDSQGRCGIGECAMFRGLSREDGTDFESLLEALCRKISSSGSVGYDVLADGLPSSLRFGLASALADLAGGGRGLLWESPWTEGLTGIPINGLVWMGDKHLMMSRLIEKIDQGYRCIKIKIGGIRFDEEIEMLAYLRSRFNRDEVELRLDANGAFTPENALCRLESLARFGIHSLEQPIKAGQPEAMARICRESPIPIALDEELIGVTSMGEARELIGFIRPSYVVLKPSLCGGFDGARRWMDAAAENGAGWWVTSALESNVGLNAIAQFTALLKPSIPQGLGTGGLYTNNITSPLVLRSDTLRYDPERRWEFPIFDWHD